MPDNMAFHKQTVKKETDSTASQKTIYALIATILYGALNTVLVYFDVKNESVYLDVFVLILSVVFGISSADLIRKKTEK